MQYNLLVDQSVSWDVNNRVILANMTEFPTVFFLQPRDIFYLKGLKKIPCKNHKEKNNLNFFLLVTTTRRKKYFFKQNVYINIHELININISADGHLITFV